MDLEKIRHSASHVLASAVKELFSEAKLGIGPAIDDGFYYDFDLKHTLTPDDLKKLEEKMQEIIGKNLDFKKSKKTRNEAEKILKDEPYKLELLKNLPDNNITFYTHGSFTDLCAGPHVKNTKEIKAFKLLKIAGAYWKGDSKNKQLQRIYGIAFNSKKELEEYLKKLEEAEKRDHRKIGQQLELFFFHEYSPGSPFFEPKGTVIYNELLNFVREEYKKRGYQEVITPQIFNKALWETSGHWKHFKEDMFVLNVDNSEAALKPMNCPSHVLIFKNKIRSYRELPLRIADFCALHRNELRGVLGGLTRVRKFSQDDAHIFVTEEQIEKEILDLMDFIDTVYKKVFNFRYVVNLSTKPEKAMGDPKLWEKAEEALRNALNKKKIKFNIKEGEGAFYGPKIDFDIRDSLDRSWQLATIQLDFQMPLNFKATYEGKDGNKHTPIMIHRAILGSLERFIGILIEHYAGKLPLWLSPVQVRILTLTDRNEKFAGDVLKKLRDNNIRVELDDRSESIGKKVRDAQLEKIPLTITIGDKEQENKTLAIRTLDGKVKFGVKVEEFINDLLTEIKEKK
ncbi:threonine--tRNA ligase [Candidatus Woesearchaeota archaeon]|nr:threonine--tRNA ligase [Candidatus Woesearchaeota archaeon]